MISLIFLISVIVLIWAEIKVFALIGHEIGALSVIIGTFATAAAGVTLFRKAGMATLQRLQRGLFAGKTPIMQLFDGTSIFLAAGLLLLPGFITDAIGFILFIPGLRTVIGLGLMMGILRLTKSNKAFQTFHTMAHGDAQNAPPRQHRHNNDKKNTDNVTIEGEFERKD